ncbi:unnamed protein product [Brassica oleracea]
MSNSMQSSSTRRNKSERTMLMTQLKNGLWDVYKI